MASDFKFIVDNGCIAYVCAESRKEAIQYFCEDHGVNKEFVEKHCVVKRVWKREGGEG